jgi:hypothetical protein
VQSEVKKMTIKFEDWLSAQQSRQDLVGDLARTLGLENDPAPASRRKPDEHMEWANIVIKTARPSYIAIFNEAWQEFVRAKEATEESLG